jgi:hypothetical protein
MPIAIHIEHLIVEGSPFAASDGAAFRMALERELADLVGRANPSEWSSPHRISVQAKPIAPQQPSIPSWAAASAQSLFQTIVTNCATHR